MGLVDFIMARGQSAHPRAVGDACFLSDTHACGIIAALIADTVVGTAVIIGGRVGESQSFLTVELNFSGVGSVQTLGPFGFFLVSSEALRDDLCFCCWLSSLGAVCPRWRGSLTFLVASLVLPSLLTAI